MLAFILAATLSGASCANPSIVTAGVASVSTVGKLNHYTIAITIENLGAVRQPGNLLESLDVFQNDQKVGQIGLQPLRPKQSQKVTYSFDRSADAGGGTTKLSFALDLNGRSGKNIDCHAGVETFAMQV
jgi:hypothetical protein